MKNILVTGAYGFIGSNISSYFKGKKGFCLLALDILKKNTDYFSYYSWDDLNDINWNNIDTIIHLAGKAHDTKNASTPQSYVEINVGLTKEVYRRFLDSAAKSFIFFSSVKAIADTVYDELLSETTPPNPQTPYGKSKLQAEQFLLGQPLPPGKKVYILRPCMIHGPGNKGNLSLLYKLAQNGFPWPLGAFENKRSYSTIGNVLFVLQRLIETDIEPGIYQIADDEPLSTNKVIRLIADSINKKIRIWSISPAAIKVLANIGSTLSLPFNNERLKKLTESYVVGNRKLINALGIEQMPITAIDGMRLSLESFKKKDPLT